MHAHSNTCITRHPRSAHYLTRQPMTTCHRPLHSYSQTRVCAPLQSLHCFFLFFKVAHASLITNTIIVAIAGAVFLRLFLSLWPFQLHFIP